MSIYLDTNALPQPPAGLVTVRLGVLRALAEHTNQALVLVSLVVEESVSARQRFVDERLDVIRAQTKDLEGLTGGTISVEGLPDSHGLGQTWREDLEQRFVIVDTAADIAVEALRREATRRRPCRQGAGSRDAAIWLTVCRHHAERGEPSYFVSDNKKDFAASDGKALHPDLTNDLPEDGPALTYCRDVGALVRSVAEPSERVVSLEDLRASELVTAAMVRATEQLVARARDAVERPPPIGSPYVAGEVVVTFDRAWGQDAFQVTDLVVSVLTARCSWTADVGVLVRHVGGGMAERKGTVTGQMNVQLMVTLEGDIINGADALEVAAEALTMQVF